MNVIELTEKIVKSLVQNPEAVTVKEFESDDENTILLQVMVDSDDMGRVIGKQGRTSNAIRTIVRASSYINDNKKIDINFDNF